MGVKYDGPSPHSAVSPEDNTAASRHAPPTRVNIPPPESPAQVPTPGLCTASSSPNAASTAFASRRTPPPRPVDDSPNPTMTSAVPGASASTSQPLIGATTSSALGSSSRQ
jgi:hypothetical protein